MHGSSQNTLLRRAILALLAALSLLAPSYAHAQHTIHIPADQPTIQAAIDTAQPGDTLLVAAGTYYENLDLHGKSLTLQSAEGPATTILDGRRLGPTVSFTTSETRATTLTGFTIRNGAPAAPTPANSDPHGAGILLTAASPTLTGNILTDNLCAAIDATSSAPLVQGNRITRTIASALCTAQAIAPVVFTGSASTLIPTLLHNTIEANDLTGSPIQPNAGAIALIAAPAVLQANILRFNTVPGDAPAALQVLANPTPAGSTPIVIQQNLIYANRTHCGPGGLAVSILNPTVAATAPHLELQILNNTVADNLTDATCPNTQPSEVELTPGYLPTQILLANNILASDSTHPTLMCSTALPAGMFHHNLLHNPQAASACPDSGANLDADPAFADRPQADYHLNLDSPAVDAGSNNAAPLPPQDLDASPRLQNATDQPTAIVDFGAYEHPAPKIPVAATTTILNATISPSEAFQTVTLITAVTTGQSATIPTGTVTLTATPPGVPAPITLATLTLDATGKAAYTTSSLPTGPWTLTATYSGTPTLSPSTSAPMLQTVNPATTILAFSLTPSTAPQGQTVTASAILTAPLSTHIPSGSVQFVELTGTTSTLLGPATLDAKGHATLTLPVMSAGTHRILAVYAGASDFTPVNLPTADALTLTIASADFLENLADASLTLIAEHHGPVTLTMTSLGTFADTLTLSCANLPANTSCTFAPMSVKLTAGSSASATLTLDTSVIPGFARLTAPATPQHTSPSLITLATTLPLGLVALVSLRRRSRITLAATVLLLTGCGAGKYPDHTAPGTYQISIVATAKTTGITHTTPLTLTVTP